MPIVGERLNKIHAERGKLEPRMEIKSNIDIKDISMQKMGIAAESKEGLAFNFFFNVNYGKAGGKIELEGEVFYMDKPEKMKEIEAAWKKDKKLDAKLRLAIMNRILEVSYLQAIAMADQIRLPSPMQMPRFVEKKK